MPAIFELHLFGLCDILKYHKKDVSTGLRLINRTLPIDSRGHTLSFWIASILISAFILLILQAAVAAAATFHNEITYYNGSKQVTTIRVLYIYPDTAISDRPMNVSVILRYLNNTYAIPKWINIQDVSVHLRTSVKGPNIFNSTIDISNVTLAPAGKPYSRVFYITPTIPGKYFVLLNYNASLGPLKGFLIVMTREQSFILLRFHQLL
ncbi:MAG: hypothetical protein WAM42_15245 [Candidatus Nitrosopolaris sp.]|jgi:hypothetical protein